VPQSYHWAGQVFVFPANTIQRLDAPSAAVMAFIVSGGVTEITRDTAPAATEAVTKARSA